MSLVIKSHNKKVLSGSVVENARKGCNCRGGITTCPMRGSCLDKSMIYKAEVTTTTEKKHYYGQTFRTFKDRFYGHQSDLRNQGKAESTTLSKYVWQERNKGEEPEIIWSKLSSAKPYSLGGRSCPLCLAEKTAIATDTTGEMLNRRRELMNRCLHKDPYKLSNFSTSLSTGHHSPVQPHDVLLDLQPAPLQPHDVLLDLQPAPVQPEDVLLDLQLAPVQPHDVMLDLRPAPVQPHDDLLNLQPAPVQPHDILLDLQPAPVQPQVVQPVSDQLADADVVDQEPPEPPDLHDGVLRRSRRVCKRRYDNLNMDSL